MQNQNQSKNKTASASAELCEHVYKTAKMGAEAITDTLPKIKDPEEKEKIRAELTLQFGEYENIATKAEKLLASMNVDPKEENMLAKMSAKTGIMMNTMVDSTSSHVAEMMIEGLTIGITDTTKKSRIGKDNGCSDEVLDLCRDLISFQEESVDKMKAFL